MSELETLPKQAQPELPDQIQLETLQVQKEFSYPEQNSPTGKPEDLRMIKAELGIASSQKGELYVGHYALTGDHYQGTDGRSDWVVGGGQAVELAQKQQNISRSKPEYAKVFGFHRVDSQVGTPTQEAYVTAPTTGYLNKVMDDIYEPTDVEPPLEFAAKEGEEEITGLEYIHSLAEGKILMATLENSYFGHDIDQHPLGVARLDPETAGLIKERAKQLIDEGKTKVDEEGHLVDPTAQELVRAIDHLTALMTKDGLDKGNIGDDLKAVIDPKKKGLKAALEVGRVVKRIRAHSEWVDGRISQLAQQ